MPDRTEPPLAADERTMLCGWMDFHRATILRKVGGVSEVDGWRPLVDSGTSLFGLVKHLALAEHYWFTQVFAGDDAGLPRPNTPEDFRLVESETTQEVVDLYIESCERSRRAIEGASLDDSGRGQVGNRRASSSEISLRWILTHMIEETARHNGHADILRELIDGSIGT